MKDGPALYVCDTLSTATQWWPRGPFGFVGFSFIDNAGHVNDLVGGLFLGWLFLRKNEQQIQAKQTFLNLGGVAALVASAVISAFAVYRMMI